VFLWVWATLPPPALSSPLFATVHKASKTLLAPKWAHRTAEPWRYSESTVALAGA